MPVERTARSTNALTGAGSMRQPSRSSSLLLDLNPSLALAHYGLGAAFVFSGKPHEAFPHLELRIRLSPQDPNMGSYLARMAEAKYLVGEDEAAVRFALRALAQPSFQWSRYAILIAALGQLDRKDEAQRYLASGDTPAIKLLGRLRANHAPVQPRYGHRSLL